MADQDEILSELREMAESNEEDEETMDAKVLKVSVARRPEMERRSGVVCADLINLERADIALFIIDVCVQP